MTINDMSIKWPNFPWLQYFTLISPNVKINSQQIVIVRGLDFITKFVNLIDITPKRVQLNFALTRIVLDAEFYIPNLVASWRNEDVQPDKRWEACLYDEFYLLTDIIDTMYIRKNKNSTDKRNHATEMTIAIKNQFARILREVKYLNI